MREGPLVHPLNPANMGKKTGITGEAKGSVPPSALGDWINREDRQAGTGTPTT